MENLQKYNTVQSVADSTKSLDTSLSTERSVSLRDMSSEPVTDYHKEKASPSMLNNQECEQRNNDVQNASDGTGTIDNDANRDNNRKLHADASPAEVSMPEVKEPEAIKKVEGDDSADMLVLNLEKKETEDIQNPKKMHQTIPSGLVPEKTTTEN